MTHTLLVLTSTILVWELHEHLKSCLLQKYHSNEVHYISVACLVNDLETKTAIKRNCVLLNFVNFFGQFFCQFFVSLLSKNLSDKMVINLSKWPPRRSKVLKIQFLNSTSFIMIKESTTLIMSGKIVSCQKEPSIAWWPSLTKMEILIARLGQEDP